MSQVIANTTGTLPVGAPFNTTPSYSGTFIPAIWSSKMNVKFYAASVYAAIANTDWQGEISGLGDKVIINNIPTIAIRDYTIGTNLIYDTPTPNTIELNIDRAKSFSFAVHDVLEYQSKPNLMETFSNDASEQMRVSIDAQVMLRTFDQGAAINRGVNAGVRSGAFQLGTDSAPITLSASNVLQKILELASVLDEQNVPETGRWLVIDPLTRTLLLQSNLAQAQFTGDATSPVRNGLIGRIDRFDIYVSNQLPVAQVNQDFFGGSLPGAVRRRAIMAGHKSAITFAAQMTKTETLRNPSDFGDLVRGLQVYGFRVVAPQSLALMLVN